MPLKNAIHSALYSEQLSQMPGGISSETQDENNDVLDHQGQSTQPASRKSLHSFSEAF